MLDGETESGSTPVVGRGGAVVSFRLPAQLGRSDRGHSANLRHNHVGA